MALAPIPLISALPEPPIRGTDTGSVFSTKTASFLDAMHDDFQPELNATAEAINDLLPTIEAGAEAADDAEAARDLAQGYASAADLDRIAAETARTGSETAQGLSEDARDLSEQYRDEAETARDAAIGAGPLPPQAGNAGKALITDGTTADWENLGYTLIQATTTGGVGQWDFNPIPPDYSDLLMIIGVTPSGSASTRIAIDNGSGVGSNVNLGSSSPGRHVGSVFIPGYRMSSGVLFGYTLTTTNLSGGGVLQTWAGPITGLRFNLSIGTGSSVLIQLYGK